MAAKASVPPPPQTIRRPSSLRYQQLIDQLVEADQAAGHDDDVLAIMQRSLVAVITFIDADEPVRASGLTRPLRQLAAAVRDLRLGAKPALFFKARSRQAGRPTNVWFDVLHGTAAAVVDALIEWGESRGRAAKLLADELRHADIKMPYGRAGEKAEITAKHVLRWRDQIGARASHLTAKVFHDRVRAYAAMRQKYGGSGEGRRRFARVAALSLHAEGF